jgi:exonuclease VII small subunit
MEESERLRAELRRLYALATWTRGKQAEAALMRLIEEAEQRLRKMWNAANDR